MKCLICDTQTSCFEDAQLAKSFYHCPRCELIFLNKMFFVDTRSEKKQYDNHNNNEQNDGYVKMFESFLDFFWNDIKEHTSTALDFGSGPGPVLYEILKKRGLKAEHYDKFYQSEKVYEQKKYDLITSTEVFEHLQNPKEVLQFLVEHLNTNGIIALMTLFHSNKQDEFLNWWYRRDPTHITFFTPKSITLMAQKCGLRVIKHDDKRIIILQKK